MRKLQVDVLDNFELHLSHTVEEDGIGLMASFESNQNKYIRGTSGQLSESLYQMKTAVWVVDTVGNQNEIEIGIAAIIRADGPIQDLRLDGRPCQRGCTTDVSRQ